MTEWVMPHVPRIDLQWECASCHCTERDDIGCTIIARPGDELDVPLCERCHTEPNITIASQGKAYEHVTGEPTYLLGDAILTEDQLYRYHLTRRWLGRSRSSAPVLWIMLNPSTADASVPDPTIRRIIGFTHAWRYTSLEVVNLFGFRTPFPHMVPTDDLARAVGADNDRYLLDAMKRSEIVLVGWGTPGKRELARMVDDRVRQVRELAASARRVLHALALTSDGSPRHPLARGTHRIPDHAQPVPWEPRRG